jgi:hypothetical protein
MIGTTTPAAANSELSAVGITNTPLSATSKAELTQKVSEVMDLVMNASLSSDLAEIRWTAHPT